MKIAEGIEIVDLALYLEKEKALVMADFHIGMEESMIEDGIFIPKFQFPILCKKVENLLKKKRPKIVIINGDLKHEFGTISQQEWKEVLKILEIIQNNVEKVLLVKGNHDTILGPIAEKRNIEIVDYCLIGENLILHGHKEFKIKENYKRLIIAHEHPAVSLREGSKTEVFKCFLKGKYKGRELIVMPSFNFVTVGSDIMKEEILSPYLKKDLEDFYVYVVDQGKVYEFGKLKNLYYQKNLIM